MSINTEVTFNLPVASSTQLGGVAVQSESGILVDGSGDISVDDTQFLSVSEAVSTYAPLASPELSGNPTAPTQDASDDSTSIATTSFVTTAISNTGASSVGPTFFIAKENIQVIQVTSEEATVYIEQNASLVAIYSFDSGGPVEFLHFPTPLGNGHTFTIISGFSTSGLGTIVSSYNVYYKSNPAILAPSTWTYYSDSFFTGGWYQVA